MQHRIAAIGMYLDGLTGFRKLGRLQAASIVSRAGNLRIHFSTAQSLLERRLEFRGFRTSLLSLEIERLFGGKSGTLCHPHWLSL